MKEDREELSGVWKPLLMRRILLYMMNKLPAWTGRLQNKPSGEYAHYFIRVVSNFQSLLFEVIFFYIVFLAFVVLSDQEAHQKKQ